MHSVQLEGKVPGEFRYAPSFCKKGPNYVYLIGGDVNHVATKDCQRYDHVFDEWLNLPKMQHARFSSACCALNNYIYVFGGYSQDTRRQKHYTKSVEKLAIRVSDQD